MGKFQWEETHSSQPPPNGPRLLGSQIKREILLFLVELAKVLSGLLVGYGHHPGNGLANGIAVKSIMRNPPHHQYLHFRLESKGGEHLGELGGGSTSDFLYA